LCNEEENVLNDYGTNSGGGATLPKDGDVEELHGDQRSKMEEVVPKMARRRGSDADSQGGGESHILQRVSTGRGR